MANTEVLKRDFENRLELKAYLREQFPDAAQWGEELSPIRGGEQAARKALEEFRAGRYAGTRNFLSGSVSRLSPYLRHGVLTLAEVAAQVINAAGGPQKVYKFVQELAWRDYWQRLYEQWGAGVWLDREEWKTGLKVDDYADDLPEDVATAQTHLACMDGFISALVRDGYLHNHARMWFAAYVVHFRRVKWQAGARFFLTHLLDGDPASNNLSWQWVASTFSSKPYIFNRENLERYTNGEFCAGCARRESCPFDKSYELLNSELFHE